MDRERIRDVLFTEVHRGLYGPVRGSVVVGPPTLNTSQILQCHSASFGAITSTRKVEAILFAGSTRCTGPASSQSVTKIRAGMEELLFEVKTVGGYWLQITIHLCIDPDNILTAS